VVGGAEPAARHHDQVGAAIELDLALRVGEVPPL